MATETTIRQVGERIASLIVCIHQARCADGGSCGCRTFAEQLIQIVEKERTS